MYARMSTYSGDMDAFLKHFQSVVLSLEGWDGLHHVDVLVNRESGRAVTVSVWADEAAMEASDAGADDMRSRVTGLAGVTTEGTERFVLERRILGPAATDMRPYVATGA